MAENTVGRRRRMRVFRAAEAEELGPEIMPREGIWADETLPPSKQGE